MAQLQPVVRAQFLKQYGPYGREGDQTFNFVLDQTDRITVVRVSCGSVVDAIGFDIRDKDGVVKSVWYGGRGNENAEINMRDGEYVTKISGSHARFSGDRNLRVVAQIYVHTNLNPGGYGPHGRIQDCSDVKTFEAPPPGSKPVIGYFGRTGALLESIGVSVRE